MDGDFQSPGAFERLAQAIQADDVDAAQTLLSTHPEVRTRINDPLPGGSFGATALLEAVRRDHRGMATLLLQHGADPAVRSHWWAGGFSILDQATPETAAWLIDQGTPVDAVTASRLGFFDLLKERVTSDPSAVHLRGGDGQTPLHVARTVEIASFLIDHGADLEARDVDHESTPAQYALGDRRDVARLLIARGCRTDLLMASAVGDRALVERHLQDDPDCIHLCVATRYFPKTNPDSGGTIYIWTLGWYASAHDIARRNADEALLARLMAASPPILRLTKALEWGDEELARRLTASADPVIPLDPIDRAKVVEIAFFNQTRALERFLGAGWPAQVQGDGGASPLHWACWHGNAASVALLLARHPDLETKDDNFGSTPLGWALHGSLNSWYRTGGHYGEVIRLLLSAGAHPPADSGALEASGEAKAALRKE